MTGDAQLFRGSQVWWSKVVPLKVNIFIWRLFGIRLPTKDNLMRRNILAEENQTCSNGCMEPEDRDHICVRCPHFSNVWPILARWLGFVSVFQGQWRDHHD